MRPITHTDRSAYRRAYRNPNPDSNHNSDFWADILFGSGVCPRLQDSKYALEPSR
jgi:hypothetical protein